MDVFPFGELNPDCLEDYYSADVLISGRQVAIDLNFQSDAIEAHLLQTVVAAIPQLPPLTDLDWQAILNDWDLSGRPSDVYRI